MKKLVLLVLTSVSLLASVPEGFGQAPSLGAASSYGIFTSDGSLSNTGATTTITGKIGTNAGTVSGFTSGMYTGTPEVENTASDLAQKGVANAYTSLDEIITGTAHGTTLGNETLFPGVYLLNSSSNLAGELVLDAQSTSGALFIIKIAGPLTTAAVSNVRLINSAAWENVYWQVAGPVTIGANAGFKGTIVANGAIILSSNAILQGRALTQLGNITLNSNNITTSPVPLAVQLISFTVERQSESALLHWATASEQNNAYFVVQSSADGYKYSTIGKVSGHGTTSLSQAYTWTDSRVDRYPAGAIYYRLLQVDADSAKHYSLVRIVTTTSIGRLQVEAYPSPSQLPCSLRIDTEQAGPATLRLTDALGHLVAKRQHLLVAGSNSLSLEEAKTLLPGIYLVQVEQGALRQTIRLVRE